MKEPWRSIAAILDDLRIDLRQVSVVTIGLPQTEFPNVDALDAREPVSGPGDLPQDLRAHLGIVVAPPEIVREGAATQLLSRLRDVHCEKVLLWDPGSGWNRDVLRSLGYLQVKHPLSDGRCYLHDPDEFNQPREWNNASDWANPENFRKYRW